MSLMGANAKDGWGARLTRWRTKRVHVNVPTLKRFHKSRRIRIRAAPSCHARHMHSGLICEMCMS